MAQAREACGTLVLEPAHLRIAAVRDIQGIEAAAAPTHGGIGVDELIGVEPGQLCGWRGGGGGVPATVDHAISVHIVCPDSDGVVHAVLARGQGTGGRVRLEVANIGKQLLRHEPELFITGIGIERVYEAFVGTDENALVFVFAGGQAGVSEFFTGVGHQPWDRVQRISHGLSNRSVGVESAYPVE
ncbi:hypothetical protein D3C78_826750 [compost metagenome]